MHFRVLGGGSSPCPDVQDIDGDDLSTASDDYAVHEGSGNDTLDEIEEMDRDGILGLVFGPQHLLKDRLEEIKMAVEKIKQDGINAETRPLLSDIAIAAETMANSDRLSY